MNITIKSVSPFNTANGPALNYSGDGPTGHMEGVIWSHPLANAIQPGTIISVTEDGQTQWQDYKGSQRFAIKSKASITILSSPGQQQQAPPQQVVYQAPVQQQYQQPQQNQTQNTGGKGEECLARCADLTVFYVQQLQQKGFSREEAITLGNGAQIASLWWFGEKTC